MSRCPVCRNKEMNWLHEESCRSKNPLAWFFLDFSRAKVNKDNLGKEKAVIKYRETVNNVMA